jgi:MFS family permease
VLVQSAFWATIGGAAAASPFLWSWLLDRFAGGRSMAILVLATACGALLPLLLPNAFGLILSAFVFGSAFFAVVASTTTFVRKNLHVGAWPAGIAAMTVAFSLGQVFGPTAIGAIADLAGSLDAGLWISAGVLAASGALAALQPDLPVPAAQEMRPALLAERAE